LRLPSGKTLHRVHKGALDFFEHDDPEEQQHGGDGGGNSQAVPRDRAAQVDRAEGFDDWRHRVEVQPERVFFRNHARGVDHRRGIHGELDPEGDEEGEITVFRGERGNDDAGSEAKECHDPEKDGCEQENHRPIGIHRRAFPREPSEEGEKEQKLDRELDEVGNNDRERRDEARKVDFAENAGVGHEGGGGFCEAGREVVPRRDAGEIKEHRRQAVGGELGQSAEDHREHGRGEQRLDEKPQRTENRLLVNGDEIPPHEHPQQTTIVPDIAQLQIPPTSGWIKHHVPVFVIGVGRYHSEGRESGVKDCGRRDNGREILRNSGA